MRPLWSSTNRWLSWFHRWAGVVLCLFFAMWFVTGAVLHFVGFPSLTHAEQVAGGEPIELSRIHLTPQGAFAAAPGMHDWRLLSVAGRPVYVATPASGPVAVFAADTGERLPLLSAALGRTVAERFAGRPALAIEGPIDTDQWIVHQHFDPYRPFFRVRLDDQRRTDLYVSARSGEVLQRTRGAERGWNWCGAVTHWIYFTALRKSWSAWNQVVWWLALAGLLASAVGTWLGILRFTRNRSASRRSWSPFRGWMRWHHIIGLFASVFVVGWILSGWLSMDHGRLFSHADPTPAQVDALRGMDIATVGRVATVEALGTLSPASVVHFNAIAGRPVLSAEGPRGANPRVLWFGAAGAKLQSALPEPLLLEGLARAWPHPVRAASSSDPYDGLYRLAESAADDAAGFLVDAPAGVRVYLDRHTGQFLAVMDSSRRNYAWIYYALHTLRFPALIGHETLRTVLVLGLLALGFAFSITGVVLGFVRLRRQFAA